MQTRIILALVVSFAFIFALGPGAAPGHAACQYREEDIEARNNMPFFNGQPLDGMLCIFYESGQLQAELPHKNGLLHGVVKGYYENGSLKEEISYKKDQREGLSKSYFENGKLKAELPYKNARPEGMVKTYYDNGAPRLNILYKAGAAISGTCYRQGGQKVQLSSDDISNWNSGQHINCQ